MAPKTTYELLQFVYQATFLTSNIIRIQERKLGMANASVSASAALNESPSLSAQAFGESLEHRREDRRGKGFL
ncbi:hypothetical protein SUGI_0147680 [Cryptomeria japonica]|nr:hypothetical protein SUGI_0147680 [Cryptomeria japonica]